MEHLRFATEASEEVGIVAKPQQTVIASCDSLRVAGAINSPSRRAELRRELARADSLGPPDFSSSEARVDSTRRTSPATQSRRPSTAGLASSALPRPRREEVGPR